MNEVKYICPKCLEGECIHCKSRDKSKKQAYKCNNCGYILFME